MKISFIVLMFFSFNVLVTAQPSGEPTEYPDSEFHRSRRDSLRKLMPPNSVTVVFSFPLRTYSNDVDYAYHANPDLFYFTGYMEPNAVLFIFKEPQKILENGNVTEVFFVQQRNTFAEQWTGKRLGKAGTKEKTGIEHVYDGKEFKEFPLGFSSFHEILIEKIPVETEDNPNDSADLHDLAQQFIQKSGLNVTDLPDKRISSARYLHLLGSLREIKTEKETALLRKAVEISCIGQREVMKAVRPDMSEREIQGLHEYVHKKYGAESIGYPSIVGAGNNGCVLHYTENSKTTVGNQLILMDVGAEYHGYTADVTRTIPANGKFTGAQKAIYDLVYNAQEEVFKLCKEGSPWEMLDKKSREVIAEGLINLGIIKTRQEVNKYYPHGLGHHIGLDVHDISTSPVLKKGMVITVEPGIYIPENSKCDKKWWGIAVRIEDDVLIKENDHEILSSFAPRETEEIERLIAEPSALDDFRLPPLRSAKKTF